MEEAKAKIVTYLKNTAIDLLTQKCVWGNGTSEEENARLPDETSEEWYVRIANNIVESLLKNQDKFELCQFDDVPDNNHNHEIVFNFREDIFGTFPFPAIQGVRFSEEIEDEYITFLTEVVRPLLRKTPVVYSELYAKFDITSDGC